MSLLDLTQDTYSFRGRLQALSKNRLVFVGILLLLFLLSFLLPLLFAITVGGVFSSATIEVESDGIFPNAYTFSSQGEALRISNSEKLNPALGKDFLIITWFRLKRLPAVGEGVLLFAKYDKQKNGKGSLPGFALSLKRDRDAVRPQVYWGNKEGFGKWFAFSEFTVIPKNWFMLALSFHDDRFIGLHGALSSQSEKPAVLLLGGYDLGDPIIPKSESDLLFGAFHGNHFRGSLGPISIYRGRNIIEKLKPILRDLTREPQNVPSDITTKDLAFWMPEKVSKEMEDVVGIEVTAP